MSNKFPRYFWILLFLDIVFCVLLILLGYHFLEEKVRLLLAQDQIQIFSEMRDKAHRGDLQQAIDSLKYVVSYYPSGTKQVPDSSLDHIVETSRNLVIDDIIQVLRQKSEEDFGANPQNWLENRNRILTQKSATGQSRRGTE